MLFFQRNVHTIKTDAAKAVASIEVRPKVADSVGQVNITDLMMQGGQVGTIWIGHPSEIKWSFDG